MPTVAVLLADGFETIEALFPVDILRRAGIRTRLVSATGSYQVVSAQQIQISADDLIDSHSFDRTDCLIFPGGIVATRHLHSDERVRILLRDFIETKIIAASGIAPCTLADLGLLVNRKATVLSDYERSLPPGSFVDKDVVVFDRLVTCRSLNAMPRYAIELVRLLAGDAAASKAAKGLGVQEPPQEMSDQKSG
jgi:4-methyl-5(b-hydroxyethyl)-thiazole monophosphate biosynthesis